MVIGKYRDDLCQSCPDPDRGIDHQKYDQGQKEGKILMRMQMQPLSDERFLSQKPLMDMNAGLNRTYEKMELSHLETAFTVNVRGWWT